MSFDINAWFNGDESAEGHDDEGEEWGGIPPETYMELVESLVTQPEATANTIGLPSTVMILWMTAQETSYELVHDITEEARFKLGDWPDEDKAKLYKIEIRQLFFGCALRLTEEGHDEHSIPIAQILRIGTTAEGKEDGWHWSQVKSDYDFEMVLQGICDEYHSKVCGDGHPHSVVLGSRVIQSTVRQQFQEQLKAPRIEREISEFRAELDALFPSTSPPEGGNQDANS